MNNIPQSERFWLAAAETPEEREQMANEFITWQQVEREWFAAATIPQQTQ